MEQQSIAMGLRSSLKKITIDTLTPTQLVVTGEFVFLEDFCAFAGHFPSQPILPAIVQLAAVRFLAESALEKPLNLLQLSKVKFKGIVQPGNEIEVKLSLTKENLSWQGILKLLNDSGAIISSGHITFIPREN